MLRRIPRLVLSLVGTLGLTVAPGAAQQGAPNGEWPTYGGDLGHTRYSALDQIDADNFGDLEVAWRFKTESLGPRPEFIFQSTPLMVGGVLYTTAGTRRAAVAIDAETGEMLWVHRLNEGERGAGAPRRLSGRGLTYWDDGADGVIFYVTPGYRLIALNALTGHRITSFGDDGLVDLKQGLDQDIDPVTGEIGLHAAPIISNGVIMIGAAHLAGVAPPTKEKPTGHVRGFDARTGERKWIFHTIPGADEFGNDTWGGDSWRSGAGATWLTGSYDPDLNLLYWGIGNPGPDWNGDVRPGDNLYTASVMALDADTGELRWHFQYTPHDTHDWDANQIQVLLDDDWEGEPRKLLVTANRNAFYYVLDRETGEFLHGVEYAKQTWSEGLDENGRAIVIPGTEPSYKGTLVWPSLQGSTNWFSPSYSPLTGGFYVAVREMGAVYYKQDVDFEPGQPFLGGGEQRLDGDQAQGWVYALDALTGERRWQFNLLSPPWSGVMATGGGLVFGGSQEGNIFALDADTGEPLWSFYVGAATRTNPMSYAHLGKQYVVMSGGYGVFVFGLRD